MDVAALIAELQRSLSTSEPAELGRRIEALGRLEVYLSDGPGLGAAEAGVSDGLYERARATASRLEALNREVYRGIRRDLQSGAGPASLLGWVSRLTRAVQALVR